LQIKGAESTGHPIHPGRALGCSAIAVASFGAFLKSQVAVGSFGAFLTSLTAVGSFGPFLGSHTAVDSFGAFLTSLAAVGSFGAFLARFRLRVSRVTCRGFNVKSPFAERKGSRTRPRLLPKTVTCF